MNMIWLYTQIKTADSAHIIGILPGALSMISVLCMDLRMRLYAYMHNEATKLWGWLIMYDLIIMHVSVLF